MDAKANFAKWRLKIAALARGGKQIVLTADETQRSAIAAELGLPQLDALDLRLTAWPWGRGGVKLAGELTASLAQTCVVTFKPVEQDLVERFVRTYLPQRELESWRTERSVLDRIDIELDTDDPPEALNGTQIDLLPIALEELTLAIDPYPRHPDAETPDLLRAADGERQPSPFAVLKNFKLRDET